VYTLGIDTLTSYVPARVGRVMATLLGEPIGYWRNRVRLC